MTTLIGMKAMPKEGKTGVVLASDLSATNTTLKEQGNVLYKQQTKEETQKIHINDARDVAICMTGIYDPVYVKFLSDVLNGDINVREAVENGYFPELKQLNEGRWEGKEPTEETNCLLIATRFDGNPELYRCWQLGKVKQSAGISIGSGSGYASDYVSGQKELIPSRINLRTAIDLCVNGIKVASRDIYTGGLDLVVLEKSGISEYGNEINKEVETAQNRAVNRAKRKH